MEKVPPQIPLAAAPFKPRTPSLSSRSKNFVWASIRITLIASLFFAYLWYIKQPNTHPQTLQVDNGPPVSCTHDANITDPCLVERPFGLVLLAQMYNPNVGAIDPWLIHGLWGNFCNGSYLASCDPSREHDDIPNLLRQYHQNFLLSYMSFMWKNDSPITGVNGTDVDLWAHEWNKHGTCMSTLYPNCYANYQPGQEVVDYFATTVRLARSLPTSYWLGDCDIMPSNERTYSWAEIALCLAQGSGGFTPFIGCTKDAELNEIWYYHHWEGGIAGGHALGADSVPKSTCPDEGIKYLPKKD